MRSSIITILLLFALQSSGQKFPLTFTNYGKPMAAFAKDTFYSSKIHEITLSSDFTFEFWSRQSISCFTWHHYEGTWKKEKDTLLFSDNYEIVENDTRSTYCKDSRPSFFIAFKTDKNSELRNKAIKIQFVYDYDAHLEDSEKVFTLKTDNTLDIPFKSIPNLSKLAAIRIEYQLNYKEKRYSYLTENNMINIKIADIPNLINVEFVENPKKEIVHRTIKGVIKKDTLVIVSTSKTATTLPDYHGQIEFEDSYTLLK
jgi:hypothetical protein